MDVPHAQSQDHWRIGTLNLHTESAELYYYYRSRDWDPAIHNYYGNQMQTVLEHHKPFISTSVNQNKSSHHYTGYDDLYQPMTQLGKKTLDSWHQ